MRKHEPVSEREMIHASPRNTICEILRDIYWATDDKDIRLKARVATAIVKAMDKRLRQYKENWMDNFYEYNLNFKTKYREMSEKLESESRIILE